MVHLLRFSMTYLLMIVLTAASAWGETLNLDKALKIGTGKTTIIEFTDPDCPYCRQLHGELKCYPLHLF